MSIRISITRGSTVEIPIRMESGVLAYKDITGVPETAPLRLTVEAHGVLPHWRGVIANARGLDEGLCWDATPSDRDMRRIDVIDENTVEFNGINASDWTPYCSGGHLVFWVPVDLSVYSAGTMVVHDKNTRALLAEYPLVVDADNGTLWLRMTTVESAAIGFDSAVFSILGVRLDLRVEPLSDFSNSLSVE